MKKQPIRESMLLWAFLSLFALVSEAQVQLTDAGAVKAAVVVDPASDSLTLHAADELEWYLKQMSGADIPVRTKPVGGNMTHAFIGKGYLSADARKRLENDSMDDAFMILTSGQALYLAGKKPVGDLYAVYTLLEEFLGCMMYTPEEVHIPSNPDITVPQIDKVWSPAFPFRVPHFPGRYDSSFSQWHKVSNFDDWGMFVHTFHRLVPPETWFDGHPEYFALVDGRRVKDGQLCLGNRELMALLKRNLNAEMAKNSSAVYWSVSQNDCYNYCECDLCKEMYDTYGSISGAYIAMANEIAAEHPDKQISTLAYQFTRSAPTGIKPLPNVNVMFCSIECNRSMPLAGDPRSAGFVRDMKDWAALTGNLFVWDYVVQFSNYLTPFPNFHVLQPNIRFFRQNGAKMMFQQGSGRSWSDLSELKQYLIAKLLWNPDIDVDSLTSRFITMYYGEAAPYIQRYYDVTHTFLKGVQNTRNLDIYGYPLFYTGAHLPPAMMLFYEQQMDLAEEATRNDMKVWSRVQRARLPVDFALLDIALNTNPEVLPWIIGNEMSMAMKARLELFVERCNAVGVTAINERSLTPRAYNDFALAKTARMLKENKLSTAILKPLTPFSPKYDVGGMKAITDKLFGGLDFRFNWLGYEGEDMVILADLGGSKPFSKVNLHFLKAVESWVFLPEEVAVEVSDDGLIFRAVASLQGDNSDRGYLVQSIPFELSFDPVTSRYMKITARSMKTCPDWHRGFGKPSWIFTDEIILE